MASKFKVLLTLGISLVLMGVSVSDASSGQASDPALVFYQNMGRYCATTYADQADFVTYDVEMHECELTIVMGSLTRVVKIRVVEPIVPAKTTRVEATSSKK
jgi:hypothetical protein